MPALQAEHAKHAQHEAEVKVSQGNAKTQGQQPDAGAAGRACTA